MHINEADSQIMAGLLTDNEGTITDSPVDADVIIMNTCYVKKHSTQ